MTRHIARRIAQPQIERNPRPVAGSLEFSTGKDSAFASSIYITASRLDRIAAELTEQDWLLLSFVADSRLATSRQLIAGLWTDDPKPNPASARAGARALKRLSEWRVLDPLPGRAPGRVGGGVAPLILAVGGGGCTLRGRRPRRPRFDRGAAGACLSPCVSWGVGRAPMGTAGLVRQG